MEPARIRQVRPGGGRREGVIASLPPASCHVYRNGIAYQVGTYNSKEAAVSANEGEVKKENPNLHSAPELVERRVEPAQGHAEEGSASAVVKG
jgi:hypothetical protein